MLANSRQLILPLSHSSEHFESLHREAHGTVIIWERGAPGSPWHKLSPGDPHIPALLKAQAGQPDRYITVNEFYGWRLVRLLKSLRTNYVDIDNPDVTVDEVLELLRDQQLPSPSVVVWSGRGLHLYWLHEPTPSQALPVWQRVQDTLCRALAPIGADHAARDCARVLRLVGSINSKVNEEVRGLVLDPQPYEFHHLCNEVLGHRQPRAKPQVRDLFTEKAKRGERIRTGSIYDRWHLVYQDLLKIAEFHFLGGVPVHHRNNWLFLSAVSLSWFAHPATLADELEKQAASWAPGLSDADVKAAIQAPLARAAAAAKGVTYEWHGEAVDPRYRFKRSTLWEMMAPIVPADLASQLRAIVPDEIKAEHERAREATRDRVAEGKYTTRRAESAAATRPWDAMGISRRTYYNRKAAGLLPVH